MNRFVVYKGLFNLGLSYLFGNFSTSLVSESLPPKHFSGIFLLFRGSYNGWRTLYINIRYLNNLIYLTIISTCLITRSIVSLFKCARDLNSGSENDAVFMWTTNEDSWCLSFKLSDIAFFTDFIVKESSILCTNFSLSFTKMSPRQ